MSDINEVRERLQRQLSGLPMTVREDVKALMVEAYSLQARVAELESAQAIDLSNTLGYTPGYLDKTSPVSIWLQIDTGGDNDERSEQWPGYEHVTWHDEPIGGLEVQYVRADLALIDGSPKGGSDAPPSSPGIDLVSDILTDLSNVAGSWVVEAAGAYAAYADAQIDCASQMHDAIERWSNRLQLGDASPKGDSNTVVLPAGWSLIPHTSPWRRDGDRWELHGPGGGGCVNVDEVPCRTMRLFFDALAGIDADAAREVQP